MHDPNTIADIVGDLVEARMSGNDAAVIDLVLPLVHGPRVDALNVVLVLAGVLAEDLGDNPQDGFHRIEVLKCDEQGQEREGSTYDLPPHVAAFVQIVVAVANNEHHTARDLFLAYVDTDGHRALAILTLAINEVVHANGGCVRCSVSQGATP